MTLASPSFASFAIPPKISPTLDFNGKAKQAGFMHKWNSGMCTQITAAREAMLKQFRDSDKAVDVEPIRLAVRAYLASFAGFVFDPANFGSKVESKLKHVLWYHWPNTLARPVNFADNNSFFEVAGVLITYATVVSNWAGRRIAARSPSTQDQILKDAYAGYCEAAGCLEAVEGYLSTNVVIQQHTPVEMRPEFVGALKHMLLGCAQEIGCHKAQIAEDDKVKAGTKRSPELLTKLAHCCSTEWESAFNGMSTLPAQMSLESGLVSIKSYCEAKFHGWTAYAWTCQALVENAASRNGHAMFIMQHAAAIAQKAKAAAKMDKSKNAKSTGTWVELCITEMTSKKGKFERENSVIFHNKLADELPALLPGQQLARVRAFEYPEPAELWSNDTISQFVPKDNIFQATPAASADTQTGGDGPTSF
eukprot:NODE_1299_length_1389_cov_70.587956_g1288_i0.p1 GENE.NODE_1299_length_1389_cov_70.587956_g1288_i0~~NODE_1299_length_1389_cov_70.587956_g1288_i0.p1  ORF type:complete len:421 (-),score=74.27 NODE_1299_length_1389_cov_70.587956_g1288_i0:53-1315(-)